MDKAIASILGPIALAGLVYLLMTFTSLDALAVGALVLVASYVWVNIFRVITENHIIEKMLERQKAWMETEEFKSLFRAYIQKHILEPKWFMNEEKMMEAARAIQEKKQ